MSWKSTSARPKIAVLCGGSSPEREISLESGQSVVTALRNAGYDAIEFDPSREPFARLVDEGVDACFVALHGGDGEDGTLQAELDRRGLAYTGSGSQASRLAMSKSAAKERFLQRGVPTPAYLLFDSSEPGIELHQRACAIGYPLVVKPDAQGSSLGVRQVLGQGDWSHVLPQLEPFGEFAIAEEMIVGREFTVAMIDREVLPPIEITSPSDIFDYRAKYLLPHTCARFPDDLGLRTQQRILGAARCAAEALKTRGLIRVDIMLDAEDAPWVLEVNTIPGMTDHSLAPLAARRVGLEMPELCDRLVQACLNREPVS